MTPWLTVVIPVHNGVETVGRAIGSVLGQGDGIEILVVDDGSSDGTVAVVASFGDAVRLIRITTASGGPAVPRNVGLREARADRLLFLDDDDVLAEGALAALREDVADVVFGDVVRLENGVGVPYSREIAPVVTFENLVEQNRFPVHAAAVRRMPLEALGGFSEHPDIASVEDWDLWLRMAKAGATFMRVDATIGTYWISDTSISNCDDWHYAARANMFRRLAVLMPDEGPILRARARRSDAELAQRRLWFVARRQGPPLSLIRMWLQAAPRLRGAGSMRSLCASLLGRPS